MTYEEWLQEVDSYVADWTGACLDELPDWLSRDAYDAGLDPEDGAAEAMLQIGYYSWSEDELNEGDAD